MEQQEVIILGAGLTGLSTAIHLKIPYKIYEKNSYAGGLCITHENDGFKFDLTGHLLHFSNPEWKKFVFSILEKEPIELSRKSQIYTFDSFHPYPFQINMSGLPKPVVYECLHEYIKSWHQRKIDQMDNVEKDELNFSQFIEYYLGKGIAKYFMEPYNQKLWGIDLKEMSSLWTGRFVPRPELEDVLSGSLGIKVHQVGYNAKFYYPQEGIGVLPSLMAKRVKNINFNSNIKQINWKEKTITFEDNTTVSYKGLISTMPLPELLKILKPLPPDSVSNSLKNLRATSLYYLDVALKKTMENDTHWIYVPDLSIPFYRVGVYSNFSQYLTPPGHSSLYIELASRKDPDMTVLIPEVEKQLINMKIISDKNQILFVKPRKIHYAYVIYDMNYKKDVPLIHNFLNENNIYSCGRYGRWEYSSMEEALNMGKEAAQWMEQII